MDEANIGGITPEIFIFNGKCELCPPYTFRPITRFAYCIGILRCDVSKKTITATIPNMKIRNMGMKKTAKFPALMS